MQWVASLISGKKWLQGKIVRDVFKGVRRDAGRFLITVSIEDMKASESYGANRARHDNSFCLGAVYDYSARRPGLLSLKSLIGVPCQVWTMFKKRILLTEISDQGIMPTIGDVWKQNWANQGI